MYLKGYPEHLGRVLLLVSSALIAGVLWVGRARTANAPTGAPAVMTTPTAGSRHAPQY